MKKTAILVIITACEIMAQMLPDDGATVTVYGLDAEIAESGDLCDLSAADITGETEMRFERQRRQLAA